MDIDISLTQGQLLDLQALIEYPDTTREWQDFIEHLYDNVDSVADDDWEGWEKMSDIPAEVLQEFDTNTWHVYRASRLLYEALDQQGLM